MSRGTPVKTPNRVALARKWREEGETYAEIGRQFGVRASAISDWLNDPDGSKLRARKDSYAGACMDCGHPTSGSEGRREESRCQTCANRKIGAEKKIWTRDAIVLAIQEWAAKYGEPPTSDDWRMWASRHELHDEERAARWEHENALGACPEASAAIRAFGTWNAAIATAGFEPRPVGGGGGNVARRRSARAKAAA